MAKATKITEKKVDSKAGKAVRVFPSVLLRPRITEKASQKAMDENVYVFEIPKSATKREVAKAVFDFYAVTPTKVAVVPVPRKSVFVRGKKGMTSGGKKAYVYLKKGDKIEFV